MYRFNSLSQKIYCARCGTEIDRTAPNQKYCGECRKKAKIDYVKARGKRKSNDSAKKQYDMQKIVAYCTKNHITYGQAQNLGLLDDDRFYKE